jgi:mannose-6-phosphate isomerase
MILALGIVMEFVLASGFALAKQRDYVIHRFSSMARRMSAILMSTLHVEKPWGRHKLWPGFTDIAPDAAPLGEIWFDTPNGKDAALMIKYLFTSERLSIQVHPNDHDAQAAGYPRGKDEAWLILEAEPGATIAIGTVHPLSQDELRVACLDGSISELVDWKPVKAGDFIYLPAGTVHAIGAGITLIEVQQNVDLTYRLYDYGRPRELHLEAGVKVAKPVPFALENAVRTLENGRLVLTEGRAFVVERWLGSTPEKLALYDQMGWFLPLTGSGLIAGLPWQAGQCWCVTGDVNIVPQTEADIIFAYAGGAVRNRFA